MHGVIGMCLLRSLVTCVCGHFGPENRTDVATSVLRKPKLSQCYISVFSEVSICCMCVIAVCSVSCITQKNS